MNGQLWVEVVGELIAFGEGDYRVFYNDMVAAVKWLSE